MNRIPAQKLLGILCAFVAAGQCAPYSAAAVGAGKYVVYGDLRLIEYSAEYVLDGAADTAVTSVYIPAEIDGKPVNTVEAVFRDCPDLTEITVDAAHKQLSAVDGVLFSQGGNRLLEYPCAKEGAYTLPDDVQFIAENAFRNATGLTELTLSEHLLNIGQAAFESCTALTEIHGALPYTYGSVVDGCTSLKSLELAEFGNASGAVELALFSLENCTSLETVTIPDCRVLVSNVTVRHCPKLRALHLPAYEDTTASAFNIIADCEALTSLELPSYASFSEGPFYSIIDCLNLDTVKFPAGYLGEVTIENCPALTKAIYLTGDCTRRENRFSECGALTVYGLSDDIQLRNDCNRQEIPFMALDSITGDLNADTVADVSDAVLLARYLLADPDTVISELGLHNADTDNDGTTSSDDVVTLLRRIAGLI